MTRRSKQRSARIGEVLRLDKKKEKLLLRERIVAERAGHAFKIKAANLRDVLACPAKLFVAFKFGRSPGILILQALKLRSQLWSRDRIFAHYRLALLPGGQSNLARMKQALVF
jgi:hypothetical protein